MMFRSGEQENLLVEYQVLQDEISRRSMMNLMISLVALPSSTAIVAFAIAFRKDIDGIFASGVNVAGFISFFAVLLPLAAWIFGYTTKEINEICLARMNEIEKNLGIKGQWHIYSTIENTWYVTMWSILAFLLYPLTIAICIIAGVFMLL